MGGRERSGAGAGRGRGLVARVRAAAAAHRGVTAAVVVAVLALGAAGVAWFEPHKLVVDDRVDEAAPAAAIPIGEGDAGTPADGEPTRGDAGPEPAAVPRSDPRPVAAPPAAAVPDVP
ncbi:MAG: hypothetical protein ACRDJO_13280, partial [Actinomycetota bacterium]